MKPESLVQLIESGNAETVEEEWMRMVDGPDLAVGRLAEYDVVLRTLCEQGQLARAESLAWTALEILSERKGPKETLAVAGPFLLAVEESQELRDEVVGLYRKAHEGREGLDALLDEAGLGGGRPVRRALRTLEVLLSISKGDFLAARDEDTAARVERIDSENWHVTITGPDGEETLGPVQLADDYRPAMPNEFRVLRQFAPEELSKRLQSAPGEVVVDFCRENGGKIDSNALEARLVPSLMDSAQWKKWWVRARTAVKRFANIKVEGRNPVLLTYVDVPVALEEELLATFSRIHDPYAKLERITTYVNDTKSRRGERCLESLRQCVASLVERAEQMTERGVVQAGLWWVIARRAAEVAGIDDVPAGGVEFFKTTPDLLPVLAEIDNDVLLNTACSCIVEGTDDWPNRLSALLPTFPLSVCDQTANRLRKIGWDSTRLEPIALAIVDSPVEHFEALLWLWDGPSDPDGIPVPPASALLSKIVTALEECRRSDTVTKETARRIGIRARAVLSARKYERFHRCLDEMDSGLGRTLRVRINRLDNLGRVVRSDLSSEIRRRFPSSETPKESHPWELDDVLYATEEGFSRKQDEVEHHVNVKMKKNAKAIGDAAERGDLSENSEYKFALEERDLLRARLAQMNSELASVRVISVGDIPTDHVGIGTRVTMKRSSDGESYVITMVGSWEADLEKNWVNYKAPLAKKILGLQVGDTVEFDHSAAKGTYEIVELGNGLAQETLSQ